MAEQGSEKAAQDPAEQTIQVWQCNPNTSNQKWYAI